MSPNSHHKCYLALLILKKQGHPILLGRGNIGNVTRRIYQRPFNLKTKKGNITGVFKYWGEVFGAHKHGLLSAEDTWPPDGQQQRPTGLWPVHTALTCACLSPLPHICSKSLCQKSPVSFVFSMQPGHGQYSGHLSFGNPGKCSTHTSLKPDDQPNTANAAGSTAENETSLPWPCYSLSQQAELKACTTLEACSWINITIHCNDKHLEYLCVPLCSQECSASW